MTIGEAIERLRDLYNSKGWLLAQYEKDAIKLGIEALKRLRAYRRNEIGSGGCRLPGETEE